MNFYKHHLGDYDGHTAHLTWDEDMAYTRLLRAYYRREKPIPTEEAYRLARATSKAQKAAVDSVLSEFFSNGDGSFRNKRADEEIASYQAQAETNRRIAQERTGKRTVNESLPKRIPSQIPEPEPIPKKSKTSSGKPDTLPPGFVRFWTVWPKTERKQGKAQCLVIWKRKGLEEKTDAIVAHVEKMARSESWQTGFDPMPETYLNKQRWDGAEMDALAPGEKPWWETASGITAKGNELGIDQGGWAFPDFKAAVFGAAGEGPWTQKVAL